VLIDPTKPAKSLIDCFPYAQFSRPRPEQIDVIADINDAINLGIHTIVLEAPTGFGKSALAVTLAKFFGRSYIITGTKELQSQYSNDYPFIRKITGRNNHICQVLKDVKTDVGCPDCTKDKLTKRAVLPWIEKECEHATAEYGPCVFDQRYMRGQCEFHTHPDYDHYTVENQGLDDEQIILIKEIKKPPHEPCISYHQKSIGIMASHSIVNYKLYLSYFRKEILYDNPELKKDVDLNININDESDEDRVTDINPPIINKKKYGLGARSLIVFDECHSIETEIIDFVGFPMSNYYYYLVTGRNLPTNIADDDFDGWFNLLLNFSTKLSTYLQENKLSDVWRIKMSKLNEKAKDTCLKINENKSQWVVTPEKYEKGKWKPDRQYKSAKFKPVNIAEYCNRLFKEDKGDNFLLMSATILDRDMYCKSIGLDINQIKFISLESSFPVVNRPIYYVKESPYLNTYVWQKKEGKYKNWYTIKTWVGLIDKIMNAYPNNKGIIHVSSIEQMELIRDTLPKVNSRRLIQTRGEGNEIERDEVMRQHKIVNNNSVIISPSMGAGIDLKDDLSRFQIIAKVPYPGMKDAWVKRKMLTDAEWYKWLTSLKFVQAYGRSVRSVDDWADTYLLDAVFVGGKDPFIGNRFIPKWVKSACKDAISITEVNDIANARSI
jgi:ATP-dependent DNA helicase DinG